jgi:hypothetical protein
MRISGFGRFALRSCGDADDLRRIAAADWRAGRDAAKSGNRYARARWIMDVTRREERGSALRHECPAAKF